MTRTGLRFLIVEREYLIALEVQRILLATFGGESLIATMDELAAALAAHRYDLAVIDASGDWQTDIDRARLVLGSGSGLVFLSAYIDLVDGLRGLEVWPVVMKPFSDDDIGMAVKLALALRRP